MDQYVFQKLQNFRINSDVAKIYIKNYSFHRDKQSCCSNIFSFKIIVGLKMILNEKSSNCKVVYLDQSYTLRTKFIAIQIYIKKL
jgi:hypothetical protein